MQAKIQVRVLGEMRDFVGERGGEAVKWCC
jgi:hypothetical protein